MANFNAPNGTFQGGVPLPDLSNIGPGYFVNSGPSAITNSSFAGAVVMPNSYGPISASMSQGAEPYLDNCDSGTFPGQQASSTAPSGGNVGTFPVSNNGKSSTQISLSRFNIS
jgi:hypothetical protein